MRFLLSLLSLVAISITPSLVTAHTGLDAPHYVGLHSSHDHHKGYRILTDTVVGEFIEPDVVVIKEDAVITQNNFNPIANLEMVVESSSTADGVIPAWTVSVDANAGLYHYACTTGGEDIDTRTTASGDVVDPITVGEFVSEFSAYDHPRQIPRTQCLWTGANARYRTQIHMRYDGKRSGDIRCSPSPLVELAYHMASAAGCITN